jgi:hypothetical protein
MTTRPEIKPALWGAAGGAIVLAIIGFAWGGWVTGASAREASERNADTAVVGVLAPICAVQFRQQVGADTKLAELKALRTYDQAGYVEKGGWATMPGSETPASGVARGCAVILTEET